MKKNLLIACSIIVSLYSFNIGAQSVYNDTDIDKHISKRSVEVYLEADFTGTPYKNKEFKNGTISKNGVVIARNIGLRYNASKDLFEVKKKSVLKDDQAKVLISNEIISINLENEKYIFLTPNENNSAQGYFIDSYSGEKASLYKKIKKVYIPEQKAYTSLASNVAAIYKEKVILYLYKKDGLIVELPNSKKNKIKAFGDNSKNIKVFIKDNKVNINKESGLIELIKYYNTL
tara:strand:+ start:203 stop:898 length:696 start_codon:yes stop_codon:yes gene_type:complete